MSEALRDGEIDLDIGVRGNDWAPEIVTEGLARLRFEGFARRGHPIFKEGVTPKTFTAHGHIAASRRGISRGPIDTALAANGLERVVAITVPTASAALSIAAKSDLLASAPGIAASIGAWKEAVTAFALPVPTPPLIVAQSWHPRFNEDPAHGWLREAVRTTVKKIFRTDSC